MRRRSFIFDGLAAATATLALPGCGGGGYGGGSSMGNGGFAVRALVSDGNTTTYTDPRLVNGWGVAFNPQGFVWVANAGTSTSTLYDGNGIPQSLVVTIPAGQAGAANPTGIVFNGSGDFTIGAGAGAPAIFIFAGEAGTISGWAPSVSATAALTMVDGAAGGSSYKGLALAASGATHRLYASDFHNRRVDVFDAQFQRLTLPGAFADPQLPAGFAPFGIQAIGGEIFVSFAKQDATATDEVAGAGLGAVDVFDTGGTLLRRLVMAGGVLDAPWGLAKAPAGFGSFGGALLVGNFGDGRIHAFDIATGMLMDSLKKADGTPVVIDGLWGMAFGNGLNGQPTKTLFFAAGPNDESHGLYGRIDPP